MKGLRVILILLVAMMTSVLISCGGGGGGNGGGGGEEPPLTLNPPTISGIAQGIFNSNQTFSISGTPTATIEYTTDGGTTWNVYSAPVTLSEEGTYLVAAKQSLNGVTSAHTATIELAIDKTAPESPTLSGISAGYYNTDQTFTVTGSESYIQYSLDGGTTWKTYTVPQTLSEEKTYTVTARQFDAAGNVSAQATPVTLTIDKTALPPTISGVINNVYYNSDVEVTITGEAGAHIQFSTNGGVSWQSYSVPILFSAEGSYSIIAKQTDLADNVSSSTEIVHFAIDKTIPNPPTIEGITGGIFNTVHSFTISGEVGTTIYYTLDGGAHWDEYESEVVLSTDGSYIIAAKQVDLAGNESSVTSPSINVTIDKTPPANVSNVSASVQHGRITLHWTEPAGDASFTKVRITFSPEVGGISQPIEVPKGTTSVAISPLDDGTEYTFILMSVDVAGNVSNGVSISETPRDTDAPQPGNGGTITVDENLVQNRSFWIRWTEAADDKTEKKNLLYKIVISTQNNISTVADAESSGDGRRVVKEWTNDLCWTSGETSWEIVGLERNTPYYAVVLVKDEAGNRNIYSVAQATTKEYRDWPRFNGYVLALAIGGNTIYAGGFFTSVNGAGYGAAINESDAGLALTLPTIINGSIRAAVSDGNGGWYIGGDFTQVNGIDRNRIARINADGSLHAWYPEGGANNNVYTLAVANGVVYAGGNFTSIGGQARNRIAAINASSGSVTSWNPTGGANNYVYTLVVSNGEVYAGGAFTSIGGQPRNRIAAINASSGSVTSWNPTGGANNYVYTLVVSNGEVYAGGAFTSIGGQPRNRIAAIDASSGSVTNWYPTGGANNYILTLTVANGVVYAGGQFTSIGGQGRYYIAAIDASTGEVKGWYPTGGANSTVYALAVANGIVYVGGYFTSIGGQARNRIAAIDASSGSVTSWYPTGGADSAVNTLAVSNGVVYAGGDFTSIGGEMRNYIAAIDASNGSVTSWYPTGGANGDVYTLAVSNGVVYAGGYFTSIGGQARNFIAAIDASTGAVTGWYPPGGANNYIQTLTVANGVVYVGGAFTSIGEQTRNRIAAINASSGSVTSWNPTGGANGTVNTVAVSNGVVYVGGAFTSIGEQTRNRIAAIDASSGIVRDDWYPPGGANSSVMTLAVANGVVYAGGTFTSIGGQERNYIAAINASNGAITNWYPTGGANNSVYILIVANGGVYAGGSFTRMGGLSLIRFAAFDESTGLPK